VVWETGGGVPKVRCSNAIKRKQAKEASKIKVVKIDNLCGAGLRAEY